MKIEHVSPELRAKAEACETPEEVFKLAKEEGIDLPDEALDSIAGGWKSQTCPKCGSKNIRRAGNKLGAQTECRDCGELF